MTARKQVEIYKVQPSKGMMQKSGAVLSVGKIKNKWEDEICIVIGQPNTDIPVYQKRREER